MFQMKEYLADPSKFAAAAAAAAPAAEEKKEEAKVRAHSKLQSQSNVCISEIVPSSNIVLVVHNVGDTTVLEFFRTDSI